MAIGKKKLKFILLACLVFVAFSTSSYAFAESCQKAVSEFNENQIERLNDRLQDPAFKVIVLGRHGRASQENKFNSVERNSDPAKIDLDVERALSKKGLKSVKRLANLFSQLQFRDSGMWGSYAERVISTALPVKEQIGHRVKTFEFQQDLYYADVTQEMERRLITEFGEKLPHAFFWGHGKSTLELFKKLTGTKEGFLPTASVMFVALKAESWAQVFNGEAEKTEAFVWSPNGSHEVVGASVPVHNL